MNLIGILALPLLLTAAFVTGVVAWILTAYARFRWWHWRAGLQALPLTGVALLRYIARETWAVAAIVAYRPLALRELPPPAQRKGGVVLFVHGFTQDATNWRRMRAALHQLGRPTVAVTLGRPFQPLDGYVPALVTALRAQAANGPVDIVAHSMGGLILRMALRDNPELRGGVRRVVTLGSPHAGTGSADGVPLFPDVRAMRRGSDALVRLPDLATLVPHAPVTTVAAHHDLVVYPSSTSHLTGARCVDLPGIGHTGLLVHDEVIAIVTEALQRAHVVMAEPFADPCAAA